MSTRIALAGNPNSGKTTLFNALTGSNQFVGNWPGVTVEKKEGKLKKHDDVTITDLPGIYSLSPYTLEEVVARNYLINERPDAILNIIDGTNLERNLYLTTQLTELGIPVVVAVNMMDIVNKNGDQINIGELSRQLGCKVVDISALKGDKTEEAAEEAIKAARNGKTVPLHTFSGPVEHAIAHIEEAVVHDLPEEQQRWYAIKIFERDDKVLEQLNIPSDKMAHIENDIKAAEKELDDDAESIITNERYVYIAEVIKSCYKKKNAGALSTSDKIDKVVTNRWLGLPIFAAVMFLVYWIAMVAVGAPATDWANDGLFGDGYHLFGMDGGYGDLAESYAEASAIVDGYDAYVEENGSAPAGDFIYTIEDEETLEISEETATLEDYDEAIKTLEEIGDEPDPADYGTWIPGIPALVESGLDAVGAADWLKGLILDGIVAGVGAVLGFVPQMLVLFLMLAFLEACGYMARIAFVLDRIFRRFGLSGKSFIPMLIGVGCGVPGIMASRTIENERDRRMTIMTTTFIPCGAKIPVIALFAGAFFAGSAFLATVFFAGSDFFGATMALGSAFFAGACCFTFFAEAAGAVFLASREDVTLVFLAESTFFTETAFFVFSLFFAAGADEVFFEATDEIPAAFFALDCRDFPLSEAPLTDFFAAGFVMGPEAVFAACLVFSPIFIKKRLRRICFPALSCYIDRRTRNGCGSITPDREQTRYGDK